MTQHYFLVLELPGGTEMKFEDSGGSPENFLNKAAKAISSGAAKIISNRNDTGASEEIRVRAGKLSRFTTFLLLQMQLDSNDFTESTLYKKAATMLSASAGETVITTTDTFQLVTIEA